ncbi:hypothetical protein SERLA73DRAFT_161374 [Serpula lacrymans var. lacrymans S7.3]|uniref:Tyrosine specific protein phosphatases domain-containing protein n=2 Tax=Serpula lacrymans var. lacrymans TaxID=341189 RepID=F8Q209_SERL3|nr:uncharacterized protein SERLADRAFT_471286 [Serpula lacrymans var. lacrymans S7.9]EGN97220.1 hypothetical protein SERLA73DRAFT_161374 [Serpula lacrymans var. lacrymans S7.3]EGO22828.1 hypothetical protein SERLADRAFT_471286 [Serpula lacrymans var. lacrymans S7.9]
MALQDHSSPPFIVIDGVHNFRMIGQPFINIKPNIIFRSGDPIGITEEGRKELVDRLKIKTIVDMRLERPPVEHNIDGTQWLFVSSEEQQTRKEVQLIESWMQQLELAEQQLELWVQEAELYLEKEKEEDGEQLEKLKQQEIELEKQLADLEKQLDEEQSKPEQWSQAFPPKLNLDNFQEDAKKEFIKTYTEALKENKSAFELFFKHIKNNPGQPVLVHCSAGKDRTGLAIALLLMTLGVDDKAIAHDYALSSIGIKPISPKMKEQLKARFEASGRGYNPQGMENFLDVKDEIMLAVLEAVRVAFDGIENYLKTYLNLTAEDIEIIRGSLAVN